MIKRIQTKILLTLLAGCLFLLLGTQAGYAAAKYTESEPNDSIAKANVVSVSTGNSFHGVANGNNDIDWVKFTIKKGGSLELVMNGCLDDFFDSCITLYAADDLSNSIWNSRCEWNDNLGRQYLHETIYLSKGTYYLKIEPQPDSSTSETYSLIFKKTRLFDVLSEPNDSLRTAKSIKTGIVYHSTICHCNGLDCDYLKLTFPKATQCYITVKYVKAGDAYGHLDLEALDGSGETRRGNYVRIDKNKKVTYDPMLPAGTTYLKLDQYEGEYYISVTTMPAKVKGVHVKKKGKKKIRVTWKKVASATGYKVYRSTKKNSGYRLKKTIKGSSKTAFIDKKVKKGKKYYYWIIAYKKVQGVTIYGKASKTKSVKR